ncbi:nucleoside phosphorylase [Flavobacteriales bacterium AH-315-E23]|nr:nucleoside phosphorylase [Flavobacteriales bacterium AH-315-E23]
MDKIPESELVLNPDGSIYHLKLKPEHIANDIIVVGDQSRVNKVSDHFDHIEHKIQNREFVTHTGTFNGKRISAMSTGIGTDNIDIVLNELDAIVNIDLETRTVKEEKTSLNIIRLGTSGAVQEDIPVDSMVLSSYGLGFDGLLNFYASADVVEQEMSRAFIEHTGWGESLSTPYIVKASEALVAKIGEGMTQGITATAPGFYGPQGRVLRLPVAHPAQNEKLGSFSYENHRITNYEMETSALYGLGKMLGHNTCTVCAIIANRIVQKYSKDYQTTVSKMIKIVLERLTA